MASQQIYLGEKSDERSGIIGEKWIFGLLKIKRKAADHTPDTGGFSGLVTESNSLATVRFLIVTGEWSYDGLTNKTAGTNR